MGRLSCVGALIRDGRGRICVPRRSSTRAVRPGSWDIVGGHVEDGETHADALVREVSEETGWRAKRVGPVVADREWTHGGVTRRETDYMVEIERDLAEPRQDPAEHDAYAWVGLDNLETLMDGRSPTDRKLRDIVSMALRARWPDSPIARSIT